MEYLAYLPTDTLIVSEEIWSVRIFPFPDQYLVDWDIDQKCLGPDSLVIDEYHYGGAAFRGCESWNLPEGAYDSLFFVTTSERKSQVDGNHSRPEWVAMYGSTETGMAGMAMIQHRGNLEISPTCSYSPYDALLLLCTDGSGTFYTVIPEITIRHDIDFWFSMMSQISKLSKTLRRALMLIPELSPLLRQATYKIQRLCREPGSAERA